MLLDLNKEIDVRKFLSRSKTLLDKRCIVDLTEKTNRTLKQNKYLHVILSYFGMELGYTLEESKELFKRLSKDIFRYEKNGLTFYKSSAIVTKAELTTSIDRFRRWSNDSAGLYIPEANEKQFLQEIEIKTSQNQYL